MKKKIENDTTLTSEIKFSVLLSVYHKENPQLLDEALESIENQTLLPAEMIVVKDGPLTKDLDEVIDKHCISNKIEYKIVTLEQNSGLGKALNEGLKYCSFELVARMDSDDISVLDRFEKQLAYLGKNPDIDVIGGWICEFEEKREQCERERRVPLSQKEIEKFAKYRSPMNHVTAIFRKNTVLAAGGYLPMNGFEDYYLWMRMIMKKKKFANLPTVLVKVRIGQKMITRRHGIEYFKDEWALEQAAYKLGFWSRLDICKNFFARMLTRLLPMFLVERLYNLIRKF